MNTSSHHAPSARQTALPFGTSMALSGSADLFDASPIPSFAIDAGHKLTHMNRACEAMLGVEAKPLVGATSLGRQLYGQDRPLLADLVVDGCLAERFEALYGDRYRRSGGLGGACEAQDFFPAMGQAGRWLLMTAQPLRDPAGKIVGAIQTLTDISDSKQTEAKLLAAQQALNAQLSLAHDQLVQSEKLASIGQLAAGVAHEINNPIGYIFSNFGTLEKYMDRLFEMLSAYRDAEPSHGEAATRQRLGALRERIELDYLVEDIPALMRESREGIERVRKIVQDLKDFSHVDATRQWQFANLGQCIESTLNVVNNEIKYKAEIVREMIDVPEVECHASEINQVIMNLLVNAAQAIGPERGTITVRNGCDGNMVWFEVQDNGCGIAKEHLARVFDPFYTTKPVGKGTGLGLSISYGIVQKHNGQITVRTEPGRGTTFRVQLPIEQPRQQAADADGAIDGARSGSSKVSSRSAP